MFAKVKVEAQKDDDNTYEVLQPHIKGLLLMTAVSKMMTVIIMMMMMIMGTIMKAVFMNE